MLQTNNRYKVIDVTIANGAALSSEIDLEFGELFAIQMPAAWTTANLTVQASAESGGTFYNVYDDASTPAEVTIPVAQQRVIALATNAKHIAPLRFIKLRSGTSGTAVNQAAERVLKLICKV